MPWYSRSRLVLALLACGCERLLLPLIEERRGRGTCVDADTRALLDHAEMRAKG